MGLFDDYRKDRDGGFYDSDDVGKAIESGDVKVVPGSNGKIVYDPHTGKEYWGDTGKRKKL